MGQDSTIPKSLQKNSYNSILRRILGKIPEGLKLIIVLFVLTRIVLTFVGIATRNYLITNYNDWYQWHYSKIEALDIWSVWDSGWYLDIANNGYSTVLHSDLPKMVVAGQANIGFFPMYPILIKAFGILLNNNYLGALLVSNLELIASAVFLYKLVLLNNDKSTATKAVIFLFIFPTSFVLSGIFSESTFLLLSILAFYFAKEKKWLASGISGLLLSLTRPTGVLCLLPIFYLYIKANNFKLKKNILYLLLYPLGLFIFFAFLYFLTGDFFAYIHSKDLFWGASSSNPIEVLMQLFIISSASRVIALFITAEVGLLILTFKKLPLEYSLFAFLFIVFTLVNGAQISVGIPRMSSAIFPFYISLAVLFKDNLAKNISFVFLLSIQLTFMAMWSVASLII